MIISEQEKKRILKLHKEFSIIKEQEDATGEDTIQGISASVLHPITQNFLTKGITKNVFQIIRMMVDCHWKGDSVDADHPLVVVGPMGYGYSGNEVIMERKGSEKGPKFCLVKKSRAVCFNPCKLGVDESSWKNSLRHGEWNVVRDEIVPAIAKMLDGSTIDNTGATDDDELYDTYEKGGNLLGWRADGNGIDAKFTIKKI